MGAWGYHSLQNDAGLNELDAIFEQSDFVEHVRKSLMQSVHECPDEIRAVAQLIQVLAKNGLWQHESEQELVALAVARLESILNQEVFTNVNYVGEVIHLRNQLREVAPDTDIEPDVPRSEP